nr:hypothetical protein CFP56_22445 [Quercus suber]
MTNSNLSQDIEILQSKASSLRAGLPWAFRTADAHYVLDLVRQLPGGIPSHLHVNKVYYSRDVTAIVRDLGGGVTKRRKGSGGVGQGAGPGFSHVGGHRAGSAGSSEGANEGTSVRCKYGIRGLFAADVGRARTM